MEKVYRNGAIYFFLQGLAVTAWWVLLYFVPNSRKLFTLGNDENTLLAFWLPDLFFLSLGSFAVSVLIFFRNRFLTIVLWFVVGAFTYAEVYCLSFALLTDTGWIGVTLMFPAVIWSGNFAVALSPPIAEKMFRRAKESPTNWILLKTFAQIVIVWTLILFVFPVLIVGIEQKLGTTQFSFPFQKILACILFLSISLIGVSGAITMSKIGRGTPLPMDTASRLVVSGIYGYVRNPMAVSGIGQGLMVGLFLGSPLVLAYALLGALVWQLIFRPLEEDDLQKNFGADYEKYRKNVRCWIPRKTPYKILSEFRK